MDWVPKSFETGLVGAGGYPTATPRRGLRPPSNLKGHAKKKGVHGMDVKM